MDGTRKIIVTHRGALRSKYGPALGRVMAAVEALVAADAGRGIASQLVALDSREEMARFGAAPMGDASDREGAKRAIDAIDRRLRPHYLLILGAGDVVPMQRLANTTGAIVFDGHGGGDADDVIESDLPYACEMDSDHPADFQGPTRVVGRLPDLPGATSPAYLEKVLRLAAKAKPLPRERYRDWLALTAQIWAVSTAITASRLFGDASRVVMSPPKRDRWTARELSPRLHFLNCHGDEGDDAFYGQAIGRREKQRVLASASLRGNVAAGTVVAAECCFGGHVSIPQVPRAGRRPRVPVALEYLRQGACGVFASTGTAYGMPLRNQWADVLCRQFMKRVLQGASLGRAALMARHDYVRGKKMIDPVAVKTLAQFCLLGDPSIHPVEVPGARRALRRPAVDQARLAAQARERRRERERQLGRELASTQDFLHSVGVDEAWQARMLAAARKHGVEAKLVKAFALAARGAAAFAGDTSPDAIRSAAKVVMMVGTLKANPQLVPRYVAIVGQVAGGKVVRTWVGESK
jgi:hypothetical protein